MNHKNNYEAQLALIQADNINVSSTNDGKDFIILLSGVVGLVLLCLFSFNFLSSFCIDKMSVETQLQIESFFTVQEMKTENKKYEKQLAKLNYIKNRIIENDKNLENKSKFPIQVLKNKEINAMISPNGSIFFTEGILNENLSEQELAFVLAHEIGHYAHRDHLKSISKQVGIMLLCLVTGQSNHVNSIVQGVSETEFLSHSREQEKNADLYAGEMLIKLYGTNNGGKTFINRLRANEKTPEFLHYFSSHPSWDQRYKLLKTQQ